LPILHWLGFDKCKQAQRGAKKKETSYCHQKEKTKKNASKKDTRFNHGAPGTVHAMDRSSSTRSTLFMRGRTASGCSSVAHQFFSRDCHKFLF